MISEEEARTRVLETIGALPTRQLLIQSAGRTDSSRGEQSLGSFAGEDLFARVALPGFDNSAMDGYAVIASDCRAAARLRVIGEQPAGEDRHLRISSGQTARIFTGAPIPAGADAVVMQEDVVRAGDQIFLNTEVQPGEFIRKRGCDLSEGQKILSKGERIRAVTLALLAAQGFSEVAVGGEVNAAILSTGDELAKIGESLRPGQIHDSNSTLLRALLERCGATVKPATHCSDDRDSLARAIQQGARASVLIVTGGVSVGEHDLVKSALQSLAARIDIWRVAIKPGKPFLFGQIGKCAVFGLPGNPVSAFVTFLQFVRPAVLKMMGAKDLDLPKIQAKLTVNLNNDGERAHYVRGKFDGKTFSPVGRQESHALFGLSQANALLRLAPGEKMTAGTTVAPEVFDLI